MNLKKAVFTISALTIAVSQMSHAGTDPYFIPLTESAPVQAPNDITEFTAPWVAPAGMSWTKLNSLSDIEADVTQSVVRVDDAGTGNRPTSASMFDMLAYDPDGRFIIIPHETLTQAGASVYDTETGKTHIIFKGDGKGLMGDWSNDFGAFDPARFTPEGTVLLAEEWSGKGRVIEVLDPLGDAPSDPTAGSKSMKEGKDWRVLPFARVSHEGINLSVKNPERVIYFVDEDRSGSIYKMVLNDDNAYKAGGQTFVLKVDGFTGEADERWDGSTCAEDCANQDPAVQATRFGKATWVAITNKGGGPLKGITYPLDNRDTDSSRPGRVAADDAKATPYGRPEDMTIGTSASGNEMLYVTTTSENAVISIEEMPDGTAMVRQFAKRDVTPKNLGFAATTGALNSPDNLAQDALGNIYIIEDAPNRSSTGGDVWFARDVDNDGVAESLDHYLSIRVDGSEATGMIFNPAKPAEFVIAVQHPDSTSLAAVANGHGDAVWQFDISDIDAGFTEALKEAADDQSSYQP